MKKVSVNTKALQFLTANLKNDDIKQCLFKACDDNHTLAKGVYATGKYVVQYNDSEVETILDELSYLLTEIGLNENDEPNETGKYIESLIDLFTR